MDPALPYGAHNLPTSAGAVIAGQLPPAELAGFDPKRRSAIVDNEGTVDIFVAQDDQSYGRNLVNGGGIRIPPGTGREFRTIAMLRVWVPGGGPNGLYRLQIETDS